MSFNKMALARYVVYDRCFRDEKREYSIPEIIEECNLALKQRHQSCGVSRRQVYYDIDFMKSPEGFNAPIVTKKNQNGKKIYYYKDRSYSIFSFLSGDEMIGISEFIYLLNIIGLLTARDFLQNLIYERGYTYDKILTSIENAMYANGLLVEHLHHSRLYQILDGIIQQKFLQILHQGKLLMLRPVRIKYEDNALWVYFIHPADKSQKLKLKLNDLTIVKKI